MAEPHEADVATFESARQAARQTYGDTLRAGIQTASDRATALSQALNAWAGNPGDPSLRTQTQQAQAAMVSAWQALAATVTQATAERDAAVNAAAAALKASL